MHIKRPHPCLPSLACTLSEAVSLDGKLFFIRKMTKLRQLMLNLLVVIRAVIV